MSKTIKTARSFILSVALTIALVAVGAVMFALLGFNGSASAVNTVTVRYDAYISLSETLEQEVASYCEEAFGVSKSTVAETSDGGEITLIVSAPDAEEASAVETYLNEKYPEAEFFVSLHTAQPLSDTTYVARTVIVGAIALVACFVYTAIRYRVSFALTQLVGSAATAALTLALNVICRIPAGEFLSVVTIAGILLYEILSFVFFEGAKKSFKEKTGLSAADAVDAALASVSGAMGCVLLLGGIALAVLCAFTWYGLWLDLISALVATLVCAFTSLMLTPSVLAVCKKKTDVQDAKKAHFAYKG